MSSYLPDVNVLVALSLDRHPHAALVSHWYRQKQQPCLQVCRVVQLGFLRTLTTRAAAADATLTNEAAWKLHSKLVRQRLIEMRNEPASLDQFLADRASTNMPSPKRRSDAYLSAFATAAGLRLVTLDAALAAYTPQSVLLRA